VKLMVCPLNGPRNIVEFACHGEVRATPAPDACSDAQWAAYVWMRDNRAGVVREWWCHLPTSYWFIAERDTRTDRILRTYPGYDMDANSP
jgi:sarcosine oxidase subunit delta